MARIPNADAGTSLVQRTHNSDNRRNWRSAQYERRLLRRQRRRSRSIQRFSWSAPEILKPRWRQLGIAHRMLDAVAEIGLSALVSWPLLASAYPQACRSMCGCALNDLRNGRGAVSYAKFDAQKDGPPPGRGVAGYRLISRFQHCSGMRSCRYRQPVRLIQRQKFSENDHPQGSVLPGIRAEERAATACRSLPPGCLPLS